MSVVVVETGTVSKISDDMVETPIMVFATVDTLASITVEVVS
jgi:hypothetical protein